MRPVGQGQQDAVARADPQPLQRLGEAVDLVQQLAIRDRLAQVPQRRALAEPLGGHVWAASSSSRVSGTGGISRIAGTPWS